ncbi:MAG: hypothetical protein GY832_14385 [Chloroflexi bacterium]|nr:hypothetical protein [Chloroflexota bacterium]
MKRIFIASTQPTDWKRLLADPEKQWRTGFSAKSLAHCWEDTDNFPQEIARLFVESNILAFQGIKVLLILPEYKVPLAGGRRPSHNDIFVLAKAQEQLISITVEGKVSESFGPTLKQWNAKASKGKMRRLAFLKEQLGLSQDLSLHIRYQLLHRTASAVIEAQKFNAKSAVMLVHSFSQNEEGFEDYQAFLNLFDVTAEPNQLVSAKHTQGIDLYCGWARGNAKYLKA